MQEEIKGLLDMEAHLGTIIESQKKEIEVGIFKGGGGGGRLGVVRCGPRRDGCAVVCRGVPCFASGFRVCGARCLAPSLLLMYS